jgi:hypothetical protein
MRFRTDSAAVLPDGVVTSRGLFVRRFYDGRRRNRWLRKHCYENYDMFRESNLSTPGSRVRVTLVPFS